MRLDSSITLKLLVIFFVTGCFGPVQTGASTNNDSPGVEPALGEQQVTDVRGDVDDAVKYQEYHGKAVKAYHAKDYQGFLEFNKKAVSIFPNQPRSIYYLADAYALTGDKENAVRYLRRAVEMGLGWSAGEDEDFDLLKDYPAFNRILDRIDELKKPINSSEVAFTIKERDIIPEGLAYDPTQKSFYLGSIYKSKILKIDRDGKVTDFTSEKQDGLRPVLGMKVDVKRRILWACSEVSSLDYKNFDPNEMGWSGIFKYDLTTGKLIKKYTILKKDEPHLFNDIVVTENGDVYFTDSISKEIYTISAMKDEPQLFLKKEGFGFLNGIALAADQRSLYLADDGQGIAMVDLQDKSTIYLSAPKNVATIGIDGLYFYENSLIAVQNGLGSDARITRFYLNPYGNEIIKSSIIELNNPHFVIPTTGALAGGGFYFIANSQMRSFDKEHNIMPIDELKDVIILKTKLE